MEYIDLLMDGRGGIYFPPVHTWLSSVLAGDMSEHQIRRRRVLYFQNHVPRCCFVSNRCFVGWILNIFQRCFNDIRIRYYWCTNVTITIVYLY